MVHAILIIISRLTDAHTHSDVNAHPLPIEKDLTFEDQFQETGEPNSCRKLRLYTDWCSVDKLAMNTPHAMQLDAFDRNRLRIGSCFTKFWQAAMHINTHKCTDQAVEDQLRCHSRSHHSTSRESYSSRQSRTNRSCIELSIRMRIQLMDADGVIIFLFIQLQQPLHLRFIVDNQRCSCCKSSQSGSY